MSISLGQLDLEALKNYLKIVHGFRTVDDLSGDTEKVDGELAKNIAIVALDETGQNHYYDRNTVENARNLIKLNADGQPEYISADGVLTDEEGQQLKDSAISAANSTADDMRSLRNEMYHLKRDMIRSGSLAYDPVYNGFIDPFITNMNLHTIESLTITDRDGANAFNITGDIDSYHLGQVAALKDKEGSLMLLDTVTEKGQSIIALGDSVILSEEELVEISKMHGLFDNGRFVFATEGAFSAGEKATNMIYKDGSDRIRVAELNDSLGIAGFASTITVPAALDNAYLQTLSLDLRVTGAPGAICIELYDYNVEMNYGEPFAISNYLNSSLATSDWRTYNFSFNKQILLEKGHEYLVLVKALGTSTNNIWSLGGFTEICNNALHQDTYLYTSNGVFRKEGPDVITNKIADLYIGIGVTSQKQIELKYDKQGLYTGTFNIENDVATRCRVSFNPRFDGNIEHYSVIVKGAMVDGENIPEYHFADFVQMSKFDHTVWANGKLSGNEFCFDFTFSEAVNKIEFQIVFNNTKDNQITEENYEALYAVVACTDNAYINN